MHPSRPVRQRALRDHNLGRALRLIADSPTPISRAQIAGQTGVTRATASALVEELVTRGLVVEGEITRTARSGRPSTGLSLSPDGPAGLGVEINVDYVATCVVRLDGTVAHHSSVPSDLRDAKPAEVLKGAVSRGLAAARGAGLPLAGVTVAVPGLVGDGRVLLAPNLGWHDVDVLALLRRNRHLAGLSLTVDNEANLAALGEVTPALRSFLHVSGEIGVGAGIVLQGQLYRGGHGWSGELGHVTVDPAGPLCSCGSNGCLEVYAGQEALRRVAGSSRARQHPMEDLARRAGRGDEKALAALTITGSALGTALSSALNLLDLGVVVLGGIYAPLSQWLVPVVSEQLATRVLWSSLRPLEVRASAFGAEASVRGAARSVVERLLSDPESAPVTRSLSQNP